MCGTLALCQLSAFGSPDAGKSVVEGPTILDQYWVGGVPKVVAIVRVAPRSQPTEHVARAERAKLGGETVGIFSVRLRVEVVVRVAVEH